MNLKELNTVNEIKNFVNGCEVMYYNVKGCMARVDNSFFRQTHILLCCKECLLSIIL